MEPLLARLEGFQPIDPLAERLGRVARAVVARERPTKLLSGHWLGHPAHPALVIVPWVAFGAASLVDLLDGDGGERLQRRLLALGLAASAPAAASGLADYSSIAGAERRVGAVHAALNGAALAVFAASLTVRGRRPRAGRALGLAGMGLLAAASHLGGHLAYALGVGVDTTAFSTGPSDWTRACRRDEVRAGAAVSVDLAGAGIVLVEAGHGLAALANRCTHRGGPLAEGEIRDGCIVCPWHGSAFSLEDGSPLAGPATRPQPVYETREVDGWVEVRRSEPRSLRAESV